MTNLKCLAVSRDGGDVLGRGFGLHRELSQLWIVNIFDSKFKTHKINTNSHTVNRVTVLVIARASISKKHHALDFLVCDGILKMKMKFHVKKFAPKFLSM